MNSCEEWRKKVNQTFDYIEKKRNKNEKSMMN